MFETLPVSPMSRAPSTVLAVFTYGGLHRATSLCVLREAVESTRGCAVHEYLASHGLEPKDGSTPWPLTVDFPIQDALIDRSRAVVAKRFLEQTDADILVMVDHDVEWQGVNPQLGYEGDLLHIARLAAEHDAIVGAAVSKRVKGQGWASMIWDDGREPRHGDVAIGQPGLLRFHYVGAAFTAYPRSILAAVADGMDEIPPGFKPIFLPCVVPHPMDAENQKLHLSEDWALCHRATELGFKTYLATMPLTSHWGDYPYQILGDAIPEEHIRNARPLESAGDVYAQRAKISLLHATRGRTSMAQDAYNTWLDRATYPDRIEYIFSYDDDDTSARPHNGLELKCGTMMALENANRGNVDAYNYAAYHSDGDILVQVHDDVTPPQGWDVGIDERLDITREEVLHVSDGLPESVNGKPWLMPVSIGTRKWFEGCGWFWHPGYVSVYCDDDFSKTAEKHGAVVDAMDLVFEHAWCGNDRDETQSRSYSAENWRIGEDVLAGRAAQNFPREPDKWQDLARDMRSKDSE